MIIKERCYPLILLILEAAIRRVLTTHPKHAQMQGEYNRRLAGYWGEKRLDEFIDGIPHFPFYILRDLCLMVNGVKFQIDTLLISTTFILILESKNIAGILLFDRSYNQVIRNNETKEEVFEDPTLQVQNQKRNLTNWFIEHKINPLPIETLVVMSNPSTIIKSTSGNDILSKFVIPIKRIYERMEQLSAKYKRELFTEKEIKKLAKYLLKHHQQTPVDIFEKYKITSNDVVKGVQCPSCGVMPMKYCRGKWCCNRCKTESKDAHFKALDDYFLLVKNTITNKEFRDFFLIPSIFIASKLLKKMGLRSKGANKNREYFK